MALRAISRNRQQAARQEAVWQVLLAYPEAWRAWQREAARSDPAIWLVRDPARMQQALVMAAMSGPGSWRRQTLALLAVIGPVMALPPMEREIIRWRCWEGVGMAQIVQRIHCSRAQGYRWQERAVNRLVSWGVGQTRRRTQATGRWTQLTLWGGEDA